jgi:streptomycin 6-kinase
LAHARLVARFERSEAGRRWLETLPRLVEECVGQWELRLEEPFTSGFVSLAIPAGEAVLKIQFPDEESEHEAAALERWDGDGAVRLLAYDADRRALLVERCRPGTHLRERPADAALDVMIGLLPRLWKPAGRPFRTLADQAASWVEDLTAHPDRTFDRRLIDAAIDAVRELAPTQGEQVLVHQDFHSDNVLAAEREPWLTIDPKPLSGEREFGAAGPIRAHELGHSRRDVLHRLDRVTSELGLDRERARLWALAQTVAWSLDSDSRTAQVETAGWLLQAT